MLAKVISLEAYRKRRAQTQPAVGSGTPSKGYVSSDGGLLCPECHGKLYGVHLACPPGWTQKRPAPRKLRPFQLVCAFGCGWTGTPHLPHHPVSTCCEQCVYNPQDLDHVLGT